MLATVTAQAHVEPGTYKGTKADKSECSMVAGKTFFDRDVPHPLNERVEISVGSDAFQVGHPPILDTEDSYVFFDYDLFHDFLPTANGAKAVEIRMEHSDRFEGPVSFTFVENNWRTKERVSYKCSDIRLVK